MDERPTVTPVPVVEKIFASSWKISTAPFWVKTIPDSLPPTLPISTRLPRINNPPVPVS